jgi:hypothetical protein
MEVIQLIVIFIVIILCQSEEEKNGDESLKEKRQIYVSQ